MTSNPMFLLIKALLIHKGSPRTVSAKLKDNHEEQVTETHHNYPHQDQSIKLAKWITMGNGVLAVLLIACCRMVRNLWETYAGRVPTD